jgi:MFS transporter, ACS family, D-galactonate transporter
MESIVGSVHEDSVEKAVRKGFYPMSWAILAVSWLAYFVDMFMRYNIPTVMPALRAEFHWSATTVGWVDSAYIWGYAVTQVPWGYVSERWLGARWTVTTGIALIALASIAFAFHIENLTLAILARAAIGVGAAAVWVPLNPSLARWFAPRLRASQTGIMATGGALGLGVGGALMPMLIAGGATWFGLSQMQSGFLHSAIPALVMMVLVPLVIRSRPEDIGLRSLDVSRSTHGASRGTANAEVPTFGRIMRRSFHPYALASVYAGYQACKYFVWTWYAAWLVHEYGTNLRDAGLLWALSATLPAIVCQPLSGFVSDRLGHIRAVRFTLSVVLLLTLCITLVAFLGKQVVPLPFALGLAVVFTVFVDMWVLVWPFTTIMFPTSAGGPIGGAMNTYAQLLGALAPVVSGLLIDVTHSYVPVFACGALCAALGLASTAWLRDHRVV